MHTINSPVFGIVLSGGGIRGVAHIGLLQALKEQQLFPSYISGTSAGAVVGALYSAGHSAEDMVNFFKNAHIFDFRRYTIKKPGLLDSESFIQYAKTYFQTDHFSELTIPLFITATNLNKGQNIIFSDGPLIRTMMASAALPPVFSPIEIEGELYTDGGITNNFPIEPLLPLNIPILGSFVNPITDANNQEMGSTSKFIQRVFHVAIFDQSSKKFDQVNYLFAPHGLEHIGILNTSHIDEAYEIGYQHALKIIEDIRKAISDKRYIPNL